MRPKELPYPFLVLFFFGFEVHLFGAFFVSYITKLKPIRWGGGREGGGGLLLGDLVAEGGDEDDVVLEIIGRRFNRHWNRGGSVAKKRVAGIFKKTGFNQGALWYRRATGGEKRRLEKKASLISAVF